tara:strand:- start:1734 stop:1913 length:180 start_codon:yes stop_codon:yes gene_type:complete
MIRNIRHIQIKKVAYQPNLFQAILTFEEHKYKYDESDEIEYIKLKELEKTKNKNYNKKI